MELGSADSAEAAANKVAHHVEQMMETSDFFDRLTQHGTTPVSGLGEKFYVKGAPEFVSTRRIPIPGELQMQMSSERALFPMGGFFSEKLVNFQIFTASLAWDSSHKSAEFGSSLITISICGITRQSKRKSRKIPKKNRIFSDDLAFFDSSDAAILKVSLVNIKPGVFEPEIQYGLVVGTISDICLYPVFDFVENGASSISIDSKRCFKVRNSSENGEKRRKNYQENPSF